MNSVLAHIAEKYADQKENLASDALAFVLRESRAAREALAAILGEGVTVTAVARERFLGKESRPDFSVLGAKGALSALVEVKFWFGLMEQTQPRGYLRRLAEQGGKVLLFVVPEERVPSLTVKLAELARRDDPGLGSWSPPAPVRTAKTSTGVALKLTSWRHVLAALRGACVQGGDAVAVADLDQLAGLVARFEADGFRPMTVEELTDLSVPRLVRALTDLVEAVVEKAVNASVATLAGSKPQHDWLSAGRYFGLPSTYAWIGLDHDAWARYQSTPLWLWFPTRAWCNPRAVAEALASWEHEEPRRLHQNPDAERSVSIPLFVPAGAELDDAVSAVLEQVRAVDAALTAAGLVRSSTAAP